MIRLLVIFLILLASILLGVQLSRDPGYLLIALNRWTIETTLWVAVIALILLFFLLHTLLGLVSKISRSPSAFRHWQAQRRMQKAQAKTQQGLIEFSEGYWAQAKDHLIKALPNTDSPLLNYLTAARAAQEMGDNKLRDDYLREAQQSMPDAKIAVELTQAQLQLANKQWEQALATLRHLQDLAPHHPYVLKLLMHLYQEVRDWPQLLTLLPELKKYRVISDSDHDRLRHQIYKETMLSFAKSKEIKALDKIATNLPKSLLQDAELMFIYCQFLLDEHRDSEAEPILRQCLKKEFNEKLLALYGKLKLGDPPLLFAESLTKKHTDSSTLYLCLGRLSAQNHLWGKAKSYFEKSIRLKETPEAYADLGSLLDRLSEKTAACMAYRQGLLLCLKPMNLPD
jgi:HemY protein